MWTNCHVLGMINRNNLLQYPTACFSYQYSLQSVAANMVATEPRVVELKSLLRHRTAYPSGAPKFTPFLEGFAFAQIWVFCIVFCGQLLLILPFFFDHCIDCASIYSFWSLPWHLQIFQISSSTLVKVEFVLEFKLNNTIQCHSWRNYN